MLFEEQRKKNEVNRLSEISDTMENTNTCIIVLPEGEERERRKLKKYSKKLQLKCPQIYGKTSICTFITNEVDGRKTELN